jgi:ribosome-binding protein aMBF1 (putative translation factor)
MDLREVFAANHCRLRHAKGLSQDDLAYEAEISRSYLKRSERKRAATRLTARSSPELIASYRAVRPMRATSHASSTL